MKKKMTIGNMIIVAILLLLTFICLYPMWYTLICSLSSKEYIATGQVWWIPRGTNLTSYKKILEDITFIKSFGVSVLRVIVGCTINMLLLILAAYPLCMPYKKFPAGRYIKWYFIVSSLFSGGMIPTYMLMNEYGLLDSFWALILPGAFPLGYIILMINFFLNVPFELYEASTIDGANPMQILFKVFVPVSKPSLACIFLFTFVSHWNSYFDGLLYINDTAKQPLQTYIYQLSVHIDFATMTSEQIIELLKTSNESLNSAKVFVALLPILIIYPFIQKYFTKGMVLGALKG